MGTGGFFAFVIPNFAQYVHGRQAGEAVNKTLNPSAFVVDGDDEFRCTDGFDFLNQSFELGNVFKVAAEQNNATDGRVEQALFFFFSQMVGGDVGHDWAAWKMGHIHCFVLNNVYIG